MHVALWSYRELCHCCNSHFTKTDKGLLFQSVSVPRPTRASTHNKEITLGLLFASKDVRLNFGIHLNPERQVNLCCTWSTVQRLTTPMNTRVLCVVTRENFRMCLLWCTLVWLPALLSSVNFLLFFRSSGERRSWRRNTWHCRSTIGGSRRTSAGRGWSMNLPYSATTPRRRNWRWGCLQ